MPFVAPGSKTISNYGCPSEPVARRKTPVRVWSALVGHRRAVPAQHGRRTPPGQSHQVAFAAAVGQEGVGEAVAELVGVNMSQSGGGGAAFEHLGDTRLV